MSADVSPSATYSHTQRGPWFLALGAIGVLVLTVSSFVPAQTGVAAILAVTGACVLLLSA